MVRGPVEQSPPSVGCFDFRREAVEVGDGRFVVPHLDVGAGHRQVWIKLWRAHDTNGELGSTQVAVERTIARCSGRSRSRANTMPCASSYSWQPWPPTSRTQGMLLRPLHTVTATGKRSSIDRSNSPSGPGPMSSSTTHLGL